MSGKAYPFNIPREERNVKGIWYQKWRGCASAILTLEEVEYLNSLIDNLLDGADISEEFAEEGYRSQNELDVILDNGKARMQALHGALGAFDLGDDSSVYKPESERIKWEEYRGASGLTLSLVKTDPVEDSE